MQKLVKVVSFFSVLVATTLSHAGPITVNDGDTFDYDPSKEYLFTGSLSGDDSEVVYGVNLDYEESFLFVVSAPPEMYLYTNLSTAPGLGNGQFIDGPNSISLLSAGQTFTTTVDGDTGVASGQPQFLTVALLDQVQFDAVNQFYDGSISVGVFMSGDESSYFEGGQSPGNGGGANPVPIPSTLPLLSLGAVALWARRRRQTV